MLVQVLAQDDHRLRGGDRTIGRHRGQPDRVRKRESLLAAAFHGGARRLDTQEIADRGLNLPFRPESRFTGFQLRGGKR
jgi:hypothetical protein